MDYEGRATLEEQLRLTYDLCKRGGTHHGHDGLRSGSEGILCTVLIRWCGMYKRARERNQVFEQGPSLRYLEAWNVVASLLEFDCCPQATEATSKEGHQT